MRINFRGFFHFKDKNRAFVYSLLIFQLGVFLLPFSLFAADISEEAVITLTNQERGKYLLSPVTANQLLTQAAYLKGEAILSAQIFQHDIEGRRFSSWVKDTGYQYSYVGENLALDFLTGEGALQAWMDSPTHRKNILNELFTEIGVAVLNGNFKGADTTLIVQIFGAPQPIMDITSTVGRIEISPDPALPGNYDLIEIKLANDDSNRIFSFQNEPEFTVNSLDNNFDGLYGLLNTNSNPDNPMLKTVYLAGLDSDSDGSAILLSRLKAITEKFSVSSIFTSSQKFLDNSLILENKFYYLTYLLVILLASLFVLSGHKLDSRFFQINLRKER